MEVRLLIREANMTDNIRPRRPEIQRFVNWDEQPVTRLRKWHHTRCMSDPPHPASYECLWRIHVAMPAWRSPAMQAVMAAELWKSHFQQQQGNSWAFRTQALLLGMLIKCWNKKNTMQTSPNSYKNNFSCLRENACLFVVYLSTSCLAKKKSFFYALKIRATFPGSMI